MNPILNNVASYMQYDTNEMTSYGKKDFSKIINKLVDDVVYDSDATPIKKIYDKLDIKLVELDLESYKNNGNILGYIIAKNENFEIEPGESTVVAGVNKNDGPRRKNFTKAHELYHAIYDLSEKMKESPRAKYVHSVRIESAEKRTVKGENRRDAKARKENEKKANEFAAQLLMPADKLSAAYQVTKSIKELAQRFDVSHKNMKERLRNLGLRKPLIFRLVGWGRA